MGEVEVVVIGGGATGAGVARDSAMRGLKTLLIEKNGLGTGTSGNYHGLLHGGGRYAVTDPECAKECSDENEILKRIAGPAIQKTGGLFLVTPEDDEVYVEKFIKACNTLGIPLEEISVAAILKKEPHLNPHITRAFTVQDAVCDSQKLIWMTISSARKYGAEILTHHEVIGFTIHDQKINGIQVLDKRTSQLKFVNCNYVINATGAWAGRIGALANIPIPVASNKGTMIVMKQRLVGSVLNRCHMPNDGDILVPKDSTCILGTTSVEIADPDHFRPEQWEIDLLLREGDKMVKDFSKVSFAYAYAGVRPLASPKGEKGNAGRTISRTFTLLEHKTNGDNLENMLTIIGGKLTTHRAMAETVVDAMCRHLNMNRPCLTAQEPLPSKLLLSNNFFTKAFSRFLSH